MTTPTNEELMTQLGVTAQQAAELVEYFEGVRAGIGDNMGIEYGINPNGAYTKFPDGTLEVRKFVILEFSTADILEAIWTYPYPFYDIPYPSVEFLDSRSTASTKTIEDTNIEGFSLMFRGYQVTSAQLRLVKQSEFVEGDTYIVPVTMKGRWRGYNV